MENAVFDKIHGLQTEGWWFGDARNKLVISVLKDIYPDLKDKRLLDCGCSEGAFLPYLKDAGLDFMAIDYDPYAIEFCKERGFAKNVKVGSFLDIPFKEESFDIVTALDVIEHVKEDRKALSEMKRVCKKGGIIFIIVPAHQWLWSSNDVAYHHERRYDLKRMNQIIKANKLDIVNISHFNILLFIPFVMMTFFRKILPDKRQSNMLKPLPKPVNSLLSFIMDREQSIVKANLRKKRLGMIGGSYVVVLRKK